MFETAFADELLKLAGMDWLDKELGAHKKRKQVAQAAGPVVGPAMRAVKSTAAKFPFGRSKPAAAPKPRPAPRAMATPAKIKPAVPRAPLQPESRPMSRGPLGVHRGGRMGAAQRVLEQY